jgi:hypothetical protein
MGATLLPVYQCVCGDGSVSMQVGQPFCESEYGTSQEVVGDAIGSPSCSGMGCDSHRVGDELAIQSTTENVIAAAVTFAGPFYVLPATVDLSSRVSMAHELSQSRGDPDPVLLRCVILLV